MNAKFPATVSALTLLATAGVQARADETETTLAWQEPGYVTEVVIATAPRPAHLVSPAAAGDVDLAWQQPGYVEEIVVVRASRSELLAAAARHQRPDRLARAERPFLGAPPK